MKRPTILRDLIFVVLMTLVSCANYSQKLIAFNNTVDKNLSENTFFKTNQLEIGAFSTTSSIEPIEDRSIVAELENPVIPYAQLPYAGQVTTCPNDGKKLPKLFLCGGNDSRLIDTKITDARSITWEKFISGGGCATVANSDCANETASASCWVQLGTGKDYLANSAGQYRVKITDSTGKPYVFYFNVYQNTLIPTAITKSDIIKNAAGNCQINGKISVGGFGNGYEYSFTRTGNPVTWQDSNVYTTTIPGNYTAFIRIKGVVGSCEFKVIDLNIKEVNFAVTTVVTSPKCYDGKGSIEVKTNDIQQEYTYRIFKTGSTTVLATNGPTLKPSYTFTDLSAGTYTVETTVSGSNCMVDTKTNVIIVAAPDQLSANANITTALTSCNTGVITMQSTSGGVTPYKYFVNINGAGFVLNADNRITTVQSGTYIIRMEDANGCKLDKTVNVPNVDKPIYSVNKTDSKCGSSDGKIVFNVTNANGYTIEYSTNDGTKYSSTKTFSNLPAGIYKTKIRYKKGSSTTWCMDPSVDVVIGASTALSASAGIAELSGCGPAGNELQGLVRITNPQGGVPFAAPNLYRYSFDNKATWITSNQAYIDPVQNLTVYIQDALGCEFAMGGISLDKKPDAPTIKVADPVFNCDGSATTTVTVTNSGAGSPKFSYNYYIDGKPNVPIDSNVFLNVTQGDHTITVNYTVLSVPTYSNLLNEDFGSGDDTTSPGINTTYYCFEKQIDGKDCWGFNSNKLNDGEYTVTAKLVSPHGTWLNPVDHTTGNAVGRGRYLAVNIGATIPKTANLYLKEINDIIPNQPITVEIFAINLLKNNTEFDPNLQLGLLDNAGNLISPQATGDILKTNKWEKYVLTLNPGNNTKLDFVVRSNVQRTDGNDVAIDDIKVFQIPKTCGATASFPIVVDGSKAFSAGITGYKDIQCNGEKNGEITISAKNFNPTKGFQYTLDGGNWITVLPSPASTSASVTLTGLGSGPHSINIRYDDSAGSCNFPVMQEIKMPTALKVTATVTKVATCLMGATIEAIATDGTPGYQYELRAQDGITVITPFQASGEFLNVPVGNYKVVAKDLNSCITTVHASVEVVPAAIPVASFDPDPICFETTASIKVNVTGGVGPYTYTVALNGGTPSNPSATFNGPSFTHNITADGTYVFVVTDSYGCASNPITKTITARLTTVTPVTTTLDCDPTPNDKAVITGTISGGQAPFTVTIVTGDTSGALVQPTTTGRVFTYTTLIAGDYTFNIKDANGCDTSSKATIVPLVALKLVSTNVNPKCNGSNDGTILLNASGGSKVYEYSTDNITYNDKTFFTGLSAGVEYTYYVRDSNKCVETIKVTLQAPDNITGTASITTPYTCDGAGIITVGALVTGGNGIYKYTLNRDGVAIITQDTKIFDNITIAGNYTVTITDSNNCSFTTSPVMNIEALNGPKSMTISKSALTCPTNKATFTITDVKDAAGVILTGPFKYAITAPAAAVANNTTGIFSNLNPGVLYTFEVVDAKNCKFSVQDKIDALPVFTISSAVVSDVKCLGDNTGEANFTVSGLGNNVAYTYQIGTSAVQNGISPSTASFVINVPNLSVGTHTITVTNTVTNCDVTKDVTISAPTAVLALDPTDLTDVTCKVNGTATINAKGGWGTYSYAVTQTAPTPGTTITQSNKLFSNLSAGDYSFVVTDLKGCDIRGTFTINDKVLPTASIDATSVYCVGATGATLKVNPNTQANYTYTLGGIVQTNGTFTGLTPGKYTIRVTDTSTGCSIDLPEQTIALPISASAKLLKDLDCDPTNPDATIEVTISGGYPDYSYKVNTVGAPFTGAATTVATGAKVFTYSAPTAGTYYFEITDGKGCSFIVESTISTKVFPTANTTPTNPTCFNGTNGSITVNASSGLAPYTYEVSTVSATGPFVPMTSNIHSNIGAGDYWFKVIDAKKCEVITNATLVNPIELKADATVTTELKCGTNNASQAAIITVTASGGTPYTGANQYKYTYDTGNAATTISLSNSNTFTINASGIVNITVTDANGCTVGTSATVTPLTPPTALVFSAPAITCEATKLTTDLSVTVTGGKLPLTYEITSHNAATAPIGATLAVVNANSHIFTGLVAGTYNFTITDANGCTVKDSKTIDTVVPIQETGKIDTNVSCSGLSDGRLIFTISGNTNGTTGYTYTLVGAVTGAITTGVKAADVITYSGLKADSYTFTVTNTLTKCEAHETIKLTEPDAVTIVSATGPKVFCDRNDTTITVTATGGTGTLYYAVVKAGSTAPTYPAGYSTSKTFSKNTIIDGLDYDVYVRDSKGCPVQTTAKIDRDVKPTVNPIAVAPCYSGSNITITISGNVFAGSGILYGIDGNYSTSANKIITGPGIYKLTVKDDNGCISDDFDLVITDQLTLNTKLDKDITCTATLPLTTAAQITLSAGGGNSTYTYEYRLAPSSVYISIPGNVYNPTVEGDYYFKVKSGGCEAVTNVPVTVTNPVAPVIKSVIEIQSIKCNGDETAAIAITLDNTTGVAPFVFNVQRTAPTAFNYGTQTTGLSAGSYTITVTDAKGCTGTSNIKIDEPLPISFSLDKVDITCNNPGGSSLGEITVKNVAGGTAPFKYFITNNFGDVIAGSPFTATSGEDHTFTVIKYGIYTVNVIDANGCPMSDEETIASPPEDLTINVQTTPSDCTNGGTAKVSVVAPVGSHNYEFGLLETNTAPYTTNWFPSDIGNPDEKTFTDLTPGVVYTFVVHDKTTDCYYVKAAFEAIKPASPMKSVVTANNVTCKGMNDGSVTFTLTDFDITTTSVDYAIFRAFNNVQVYPLVGNLNTVVSTGTPVSITVPTPGSLAPGTYYIKFIENGTGSYNGCKSASATFDIKESSIPLSVTASVFKNENCDELGIITAQAKDGTGPYSYLASTSNTMPLATDSGWQGTGTFERSAGTYYIFAKDSYGCIQQVVTSVVLVKDPLPVFTLVVADKCAAEGDFVVNVTVTDPVPTMVPYSISVNGGTFKSFTGLTYSATGLNSGEQTIIIQDKNGCPFEQKIMINPTPIAKAQVTKELDCSVTGNAVSNATITVTIEKGTSPYIYEFKKGTASTYTAIAPDATVVTAGITTATFTITEGNADVYQFNIKDANNCEIETNAVTVAAIVPIVPDYDTVEPLCEGNDGTIEVSAKGGKGPYTYNFNNLGFSTTTLFTVKAGVYPFIVKDALGCEVSGSATLAQPTALVFDTPQITELSCGIGNVAQSATVTLVPLAGTGTGPYKFSFDGSAFDVKAKYTVAEADAGRTIPYEIQDANGCVVGDSVLILPLNPPTNFTIEQGPAITCMTSNTTVTISAVQNGVGTLTYQIISPTLVDNLNNSVFTGLSPDIEYIFQVTDANNCTVQKPFTIDNVVNIDIVEQSKEGITCSTATDGKASFYVSKYDTGVKTYHYEVDGVLVVGNHSDPIINLIGLTAGVHTIEVFDDETTCPKLINFTIAAPPAALILDPLAVTPLGCTINGAVKVTAQGGWGNYKYTLTPPVGPLVTNTTGIFENLSDTSGAYTVTVEDAKNCTLTNQFNLTTPINPVAAIETSSDVCYDSTDAATLVITASLGVAPYFFSINNGVTFYPSNSVPADNKYTFNNLSPGRYDVMVQDAYGCKSTTAVNTVIEPQLFANAEIEKEIFCTGIVNGTIKITAEGGYGSYTYTVTKDTDPVSAPIPFPAGSNTVNYTVAGIGSYKFVVYDVQGCEYIITKVIDMIAPTPVDLLVSDIDITPVDCTAPQGTNNNGTVTVNLRPVNNNPDYTYILTPTSPLGAAITQLNNNVFIGLNPGDYDVTVRSGRDCEATVQITIDNPIAVTASAIATAFSCLVDPTVTTAVVTASGGTAPYSFSINGGDYFESNSVPVDNKYTFEIADTGLVQDPIFNVKDAKGCIVTTKLATVLNPLPKLISATATLVTRADCANLNTETINVAIVGGATPYNFEYQVSIDGGAYSTPATAVTAGDNSFEYAALNAAGHTYQFKIKDLTTGCDIESNIYNVAVFNTATVTATVASNVDCKGNQSGTIEINITDYKGLYTYEILKGGLSLSPAVIGTGDSSTVSNLLLTNTLFAGTDYTVSVTQTAYPQCTIVSNAITITEPDALDLTNFKVDVKNQNCNTNAAVLTIDPSSIVGGTADFEYAVVPTTTTPLLTDYKSFTTIEIATTKIAPDFDLYDVYVKDAQNCFKFITVEISKDPIPTVTATATAQCVSPYTIEAVGIGVGTLEYSLDGNSFDTSTTLTVNSPGNHTVWVRDANQCTNTTVVPVTIYDPLLLGYDTTATSICNGNEGEVTLIASGGSGAANYEYSNDGIGYSSAAGANVFGGLTPRATAYTFYVRDKVTNCFTPVSVTIEVPNTAIAFTLDPKNVICNGESTGSITVNMDTPTTTVNNNPVYTYDITPSPVGMVLVGNVFTNLPKGTYTVTVTSGKGCPVTKTIDVNEPDAIVVAAPQVTPYDCTAGNIMNNATITVALPTGGSGTYMVYEFLRNGNPTPVQKSDNPVYQESDLLGGSYVINVYDDKGCSGQTTAIIDAFVGIDFDPVAAITINDAITCVNLEDIQVNAVFTSGAAVTLDYTIASTVGNAIPYPTTTNQSGSFVDLTVGSYTITVTNPITKCSIKTIHYVNEPNTFSLVTSNIKNVVCFGTATGSVDITLVDNQPIPDNAGPFEYTITGPTGTSALLTSATVNLSLPNLVAGDYVVNATLSGLPSCPVEAKFTIAQSSASLQINVVSTPITCDPGNDGTITVSAVDGWPGVYLYELIDVTTGANSVGYSDQFYFDNLTPGDYIVNVKDSNECVDTETVTLKNPDPIVVTAKATATMLDCFGGSDGEIIVDLPTGGQGTNYSYILNNVSANPAFSTQPQSSPVFSDLPAGTYTVTVIDGLSCISNPTIDIVIGQPTKVETTLALETGLTCNMPATLRLSATGGTGSYEYSRNANFIPATPFTSSIVITAAIGDNQFYVRDTKGCESSISDNVTINELTPLTIDIDDSNALVLCMGDASASIDAVAKGGLGNYLYSLEDDLGNSIRPDQADGYFDQLPKGKYVVKVKSGIDCDASEAIEITEPLTALEATPTVTPVSCFGENNGKIIINASGGTGKIQYAISPNLDQFDTINTFERLSAGFYTVITQDENGCFKTDLIEIEQPPFLYATEILTERVEVLCADDTTGAFSILIRGGVGPYTAKRDDQNAVPVVLDRVDYTGLSGGTHTVYITDANNCSSEFEVIMNSGVVLDPKVEVTYECGADNMQANQVEVTIDPSNTDATLVQYELDGDPLTIQASNIFLNVAPGVHKITAIHANGCFKFSEDFTVRTFAPLTLALSAGLPEMNVISVTADGGRASYEYSFNGEPFTTSSTYKIYKTGDYEVIVRDQNGCTASIMVPMVYIDVCIPNYFTPNGDGVYDQWGPGCTNIYNNLKFEIFDRYGRSVAKLHYGQKWDGKYHGEELPTGDYWYVLKLNDKKDDRDFVGHFTLYR